jgi:outer membrane protein assembly factor BamB
VPSAPPIASLGKIVYPSPTVYHGVVYVGANNGIFYALDEATGAVLWQRFFGFTSRLTCPGGAEGEDGFVATATVANDPVSGNPTLYINSPDGYLYALDPSTGATVWKSVVVIPSRVNNGYYAYSSPTVANGYVYVGISSQCNHPWIHGGVAAYYQHSGSRKAVYYNVPPGALGASVWASVAVTAGGKVIETTGSGPFFNQYLGNAESFVLLDGKTLKELGTWQIPHTAPRDSDFGASPTIFSATLPGSTTPTAMVGACSKRGTYFAMKSGDLAAGPVWSWVISKSGSECLAAAAFNGSDLFMATPPTKVNGVQAAGTVEELDPATGTLLWQTALPGAVYGSPALDGSGVLAVATYGTTGTQGIYLLDATSGTILQSYSLGTGCGEFAQPVFADGYVFSATLGCGIAALTPSTTAASATRAGQ